MYREFYAIFFKREFIELLGYRKTNFWFLSAVLFCTFIAVGYADGSLKYLASKMKDPYVNWLNVEIPYEKSYEVEDIKKQLNETALSDEFQYQIVTSYKNYPLVFWNNLRKDAFKAKGRTLAMNDPLLAEIGNPKNLVRGEVFRDNKDIGLIVTERFLKEFGYQSDDSYVLMSVYLNADEYRSVPVPVRAVVKDLPNLSLVAYTPYFYTQRILSATTNPFNPTYNQDIVLHFPGDRTKADAFYGEVTQYLSEQPEYKELDPNVLIIENTMSYRSGFDAVISFYPKPAGLSVLDSIYANISSRFSLEKYGYFRIYEYKLSDIEGKIDYDFIAVNFLNLKKVRGFKDHLLNNFKLEVDMAQIEALENYNYVSGLTYTTLFFLLIFCVLSIGLFIANLLKAHLSKIKENIGTFMAFGVDNRMLTYVYTSIFLIFGALSSLSGIVSAAILGYSGSIKLFLRWSGITVDATQSYFSLLNLNVIAVLLFIFISVVISVKVITNAIFSNSPGDLIYGRV